VNTKSPPAEKLTGSRFYMWTQGIRYDRLNIQWDIEYE
jgi:hypothetical protein